jgi:hypothetical protein
MEVEEIDAHVEAHAETVAKAIPDLCAIYKVNRPVLKFAKALLFFKKKWQDAIDKLIASLDDACPESGTP